MRAKRLKSEALNLALKELFKKKGYFQFILE